MASFLNFNSMASQIGVQLYREAQKAAYAAGKPNQVKQIAEKMVNQFQSNILAAVDRESRFNNAKDIPSHSTPGDEWEPY